MENLKIELPRYSFTKDIWALEIREVDGLNFIFTNTKYGKVEMEREFFANFQPQPGGYFVVDETGAEFFLSKEEFDKYCKLVKEGSDLLIDNEEITA